MRSARIAAAGQSPRAAARSASPSPGTRWSAQPAISVLLTRPRMTANGRRRVAVLDIAAIAITAATRKPPNTIAPANSGAMWQAYVMGAIVPVLPARDDASATAAGEHYLK